MGYGIMIMQPMGIEDEPMWIPSRSATERLGQDQAVAVFQGVVAPNLAPPVKEWLFFSY